RDPGRDGAARGLTRGRHPCGRGADAAADGPERARRVRAQVARPRAALREPGDRRPRMRQRAAVKAGPPSPGGYVVAVGLAVAVGVGVGVGVGEGVGLGVGDAVGFVVGTTRFGVCTWARPGSSSNSAAMTTPETVTSPPSAALRTNVERRWLRFHSIIPTSTRPGRR